MVSSCTGCTRRKVALYVYVCTRIYIYIYVCNLNTYIHTYIYNMYVYTHTHLHIHAYVTYCAHGEFLHGMHATRSCSAKKISNMIQLCVFSEIILLNFVFLTQTRTFESFNCIHTFELFRSLYVRLRLRVYLLF